MWCIRGERRRLIWRTMMNKYNILGIVFIVLSAISYVGHYFLAAICMISSGGWSSEVYQLIINSICQPLVILAFVYFATGMVLFLYRKNK